jgi:hypothetical protein
MTHADSHRPEGETPTLVKERPIIFSAPMVRAILSGAKTQTRRIIKPQPRWDDPVWWWDDKPFVSDEAMADHLFHNFYGTHGTPYGSVWEEGGDRLWVRETWADVNTENGPAITYAADNSLRFCSDDAYPVEYERYPNCTFTMWCSDLWRRDERGCKGDHSWRSPIHMPRAFSRLTLEITDVRVQRVQEIGRDGRKAVDVLAEGITPEQIANEQKWFHPDDSPALAFARLWESINGKGSWESNPWVWAITFKRVQEADREGK